MASTIAVVKVLVGTILVLTSRTSALLTLEHVLITGLTIVKFLDALERHFTLPR